MHNELIQIIQNSGILVDTNMLLHDKALIDQGVDSLDMANIFLNIQEKYNIEIPLEESQELSSINDIANYIAQKV